MNNDQLTQIIRPIVMPNYTADWEWRLLDKFFSSLGEHELSPDFQRGHVWTADQQRHYIENAMRNNLSNQARIISFNAPEWTRVTQGDLTKVVQCLDGLQRLTAAQAFLEGKVTPFGLSLDDLKGSHYDPFRPSNSKYMFKVAIFEFQHRHEVLDYYLDLNAGGTPHSDEEIMRVKALRDQCHKESSPKPL